MNMKHLSARAKRGLGLILLLLTFSSLQGCFLFHIGSRSQPAVPRSEFLHPAGIHGVNPGTAAGRIQQLDSEGRLRQAGPQLFVYAPEAPPAVI